MVRAQMKGGSSTKRGVLKPWVAGNGEEAEKLRTFQQATTGWLREVGLINGNANGVAEKMRNNVTRFLNRLLGLEVGRQAVLFECVQI